MNWKKVIVILSFLLMTQNVLAIPNVYYVFCDVRLQNITINQYKYDTTEPIYIFQVNNCYGYFYQDYSCNIKNVNERYKWQNYTLISYKEFVTQNLSLNTDYRIQTSEWTGKIDSEIKLVNDIRDLQVLAKESCSNTLGKDYSGRFNSWFGAISLLFMMFLTVFIYLILPIILIILIFALCWIVYKKFKSKKK
jgi:hypothetical protein